MTQALAEILLFASVAINAALLIFIAGVLRKVMNDMSVTEFQHFVGALVRHSTRSVFMNTILNIPFVGAIPYFYFYGFANQWILYGLLLWLAAGLISKAVKIPIYGAVAALAGNDAAACDKLRTRLNNANLFQAALNFVAACLMVVAFIR